MAGDCASARDLRSAECGMRTRDGAGWARARTGIQFTISRAGVTEGCNAERLHARTRECGCGCGAWIHPVTAGREPHKAGPRGLRAWHRRVGPVPWVGWNAWSRRPACLSTCMSRLCTTAQHKGMDSGAFLADCPTLPTPLTISLPEPSPAAHLSVARASHHSPCRLRR